MDEFTFSIGNQNASILAGRHDFYPSFCSTPNEQAYTEEIEKQDECAAGVQSTTDSSTLYEEILVPNRSEDNATGLHATARPFSDEIHGYIPKDSALMRSISRRRPIALLIDESVVKDETSALDSLIGDLRDISSSKSACAALIIEDINPDWAQALQAEYPDFLSSKFLVEHMAQLDSSLATKEAIEELKIDIKRCCPRTKLTASDVEGPREVKKTELEFFDQSPAINGNHIDMLIVDIAHGHIPSNARCSEEARQDIFERTVGGSWRKISTRISWCKLDANIRETPRSSVKV